MLKYKENNVLYCYLSFWIVSFNSGMKLDPIFFTNYLYFINFKMKMVIKQYGIQFHANIKTNNPKRQITM